MREEYDFTNARKNPFAGGFFVSGKKGCFLLNSEKHPGGNMWEFYLHGKRHNVYLIVICII